MTGEAEYLYNQISSQLVTEGAYCGFHTGERMIECPFKQDTMCRLFNRETPYDYLADRAMRLPDCESVFNK